MSKMYFLKLISNRRGWGLVLTRMVGLKAYELRAKVTWQPSERQPLSRTVTLNRNSVEIN